ncbi:MAG: cell division protein FtsZ [Acidobacteriota bacterium]
MNRLQFNEETMPLSFDEGPPHGARIKVVGIGGGGCNAVNRMIESGIDGVEFVAANTDLQALRQCRAPVKLQLGAKLTKGLGAGANPAVGRQAALEDTERLIDQMEGADMVFVTAGLGGGTGSGGAPIVANVASQLGALTVSVVTKPFDFEGKRRMSQAESSLAELKESADTVIAIPNQRLLNTVPPGTTLIDAFKCADDVLRQAVQGISDLIIVPGFINLDFADIEAIMTDMGMALMGTGVAEGEGRAANAARKAISSPLLEGATIQGARGVLINITASPSLTLDEVNEANSIVYDAADPEANIIFGTVFDESMDNQVKVTVIATGFGFQEAERTEDRAEAVVAADPIQPSRESENVFRLPEAVPNEASRHEKELEIPTFLRRRRSFEG